MKFGETNCTHLRIRFLAEEELKSPPQVYGDEQRVHRMQLRFEDFMTYGFSPGCPGCQATLAGTSRQCHSELRRRCTEEAIRSSPEGQAHNSRQRGEANENIARRKRKRRRRRRTRRRRIRRRNRKRRRKIRRTIRRRREEGGGRRDSGHRGSNPRHGGWTDLHRVPPHRRERRLAKPLHMGG